MSNCPNSSLSILQESLLANVRRKLNWGSFSAGTGKIMIPGLCSNTGTAVTFLLPLAPKECKHLWAQRGCPSAQSSAEPCPSAPPVLPHGIVSAPHQDPAVSTGEEGRRGTGWVCLWWEHEALFVLGELLRTEGSAEGKASSSHSEIVPWSSSWTAAWINSSLFDGMGLTKLNTVLGRVFWVLPWAVAYHTLCAA